MADPTPIASDGVSMINAAMTGLNMIAATVLGALGVREAKASRGRSADNSAKEESRALIRDISGKMDGLIETAAAVKTSVAVVQNDVATVKAQQGEVFRRLQTAESNAAVALDRTRHHIHKQEDN